MQNIIIIGGVIVLLIGGVSIWIIAGRNGKHRRGSNKLADSLRDEKQKSDIILSAIEDGVILLDKQQTIQLFNQGASTITGWPEDEARGLDFQSVIKLTNNKGEAYDDAHNPFLAAYAQATTVRDNAAVLVTRDDKYLPISLSVSPIFDEDESVTAAVAIFRDTSQERQEEAQRAEFISTASHEMRTPVAAIEGYLSLALNEKVSSIDARARGYLDKAYASTRHLGELFQDLLTSAKAEDGRLTNHPSVVEMGDFLEQLAEDLRFSAEKKGLVTEFMIGSSKGSESSKNESMSHMIKPLYFVYADPDRLREVITNLFDNAVKYTEGGRITIGLTGNNDVVQIYVRDTGAGIASNDIGHLFQKFYRVDNSATRTIGGTGLGLFICRKIIELYNGRIWVESEMSKGSTFYINMPRLERTRAEELSQQEARAAAQSAQLPSA